MRRTFTLPAAVSRHLDGVTDTANKMEHRTGGAAYNFSDVVAHLITTGPFFTVNGGLICPLAAYPDLGHLPRWRLALVRGANRLALWAAGIEACRNAD